MEGSLGSQQQEDQIYALEHPLLRAPYEGLSSAFRSSQKLIDREIEVLVKGIKDMQKKKANSDAGEAAKTIRGLMKRLRGLKRKVVTTFLVRTTQHCV